MPRESERDDLWTDAQPTTILLSRAGDEWRATQRGVTVEGCGPTAPLAAAQYCRLVAEDADADGVGATGATSDAAAGAPSDRWESATRS